MSDNEIRIAIAEACGWTFKGDNTMLAKDAAWFGGVPNVWYPPNSKKSRGLPDYPNDLNAMHEAEELLVKQNIYGDFMNALTAKVCQDAYEPINHDTRTIWRCFHATARQR